MTYGLVKAFRIMTELDEDYLFPPHVFEIMEEEEEKVPEQSI